MNGYGNEDGGTAIQTPTRIVVCRYSLGDTVYHRLAAERRRGMVTGLVAVGPTGIAYLVTWPDMTERRHFECELSTEFVPESGE